MTVRGDSKVSAALAMAAAETDMFRSGEEQARAAPASPKPELFLADTLGNTGALELQQRRRSCWRTTRGTHIFLRTNTALKIMSLLHTVLWRSLTLATSRHTR
ncbi:hypothetical protein DIPPA_35836 [Diplonema papillatum]|nr:hypothetical protein DIPPA_35836 [Diplonema papillatum]